jgi:hypothetical protein
MNEGLEHTNDVAAIVITKWQRADGMLIEGGKRRPGRMAVKDRLPHNDEVKHFGM